jgi:hypothetical protein
MFTQRDLRTLLNAKPFMPFRLWLSDGSYIDVRSPEVASPGRNYVLIWSFDPNTPEEGFDRHTTVWYMHVTRTEALKSGNSPFQAPSEPPSEMPTPV